MLHWYEIEQLQKDGERRYAPLIEARAVDRVQRQAGPSRLARGKIELGRRLERWGQALQRSGQTDARCATGACC